MYRITKLFVLVVVLVSLPTMMVLPVAHATSQLKTGDTWTITGTYSYSDKGWGPELGKYSEIGHYMDTFKVDKTFGTEIAISEVDTVNWATTGTGWFGDQPAGQTYTGNYRYIINSTTLRYISTTSRKYQNVNSTGYPNFLLVDPSKLIQGSTIAMSWLPPSAGNTTNTVIDIDAMVSGSITETVNGSSLTLWNVTHTGDAIGEWNYYTGQPYINRYSVGPETDAYLYESTYGIIAGWSVTGTYTAYEHCPTGCAGGWTENYVSTGLLTSSNINFGS